jgi:tRNA(His) 5'-end guanylyltransferase
MAVSKSDPQDALSLEDAMRGVLALLVDERENRTKGDKSAEKTEILLAKAGVPIDGIAAVTGKKRDAVRMAISRAKGR